MNPTVSAHSEDVVTHSFGADEVIDALKIAKDGRRSGKVVVNLWFDE